MTDFVASVTPNHDCTAGHTTLAAAISSAHQVAGAAVHLDRATDHFRAYPVAGVPVNFDTSTLHFATEMTTGISLDRNLPGVHFGANPMNSRQITRKMDLLVGGITADSKKVGQRYFFVAVEDNRLLDVSQL